MNSLTCQVSSGRSSVSLVHKGKLCLQWGPLSACQPFFLSDPMRQLPLPFCLIFDLPVDEPIADLFDYSALTLLNGHEVFASLISNLCLSVTSSGWRDLVQLVCEWSTVTLAEASMKAHLSVSKAAGDCGCVCCIAAISLSLSCME